MDFLPQNLSTVAQLMASSFLLGLTGIWIGGHVPPWQETYKELPQAVVCLYSHFISKKLCCKSRTNSLCSCFLFCKGKNQPFNMTPLPLLAKGLNPKWF